MKCTKPENGVSLHVTKHMKRKLKPWFFILSAIGISGLLAPGLTFAQYEYYDPYSNSNIDYFPMNPVTTYTSPSQTVDSGTSGGTSGVTTSGGTTGTTNTTMICANEPIANPSNTRSVEIRNREGKAFFLSPPKEELVRIRAYPETSKQIFKIIYGASGIEESKYVVGLITVDNYCYPKYGYVQNNAVTTSETSLTASSPTDTQTVEPTTVPENATAVKLDPVTGEVFNAKTGESINDARYDALARKIYYRNTYSTFGTVFTDTTGYVSIDLRGMVETYPPPPPPLKVDVYKAPVQTPVISIGDVDRNGAIDKKASPPPPPPQPPRPLTGSDSGVGELSDKFIGDPDFDLLNINVGGDELEKFRADVSTADQTKHVMVRGWDPDKKAEIVGRPEDVKTSKDLKVYVEAVALSDAAIQGITIKGKALEVTLREQGKLFWFIPVELPSIIVVDFKLEDSTGDLIDVRFPWWHIFVKKNHGPGALKKELSGVSDSSKWQKVDNSEAPTDISRLAQTLRLISNIMKTKHDTVKNSISNVR